jgi:hypothetical protein
MKNKEDFLDEALKVVVRDSADDFFKIYRKYRNHIHSYVYILARTSSHSPVFFI